MRLRWTLVLLAACKTGGPLGSPPGGEDTGPAPGTETGTSGGGETDTDPGGGGTGTDPGQRYHPVGYDAPEVHGPPTLLQTETDCRSCHGNDLSGGTSGVACDSCHVAGWQTDCTYCHGGVTDTTGAPPDDIDGNADPATISFVPHPSHVSGRIAASSDCSECHAKPTDVLTAGHLFDDATPGRSEVTIAKGGTWDAATGSCSNLYCHGDGQTASGVVSASDGPKTCHDCHADETTPDRWADMSGDHELHLDKGYACSDCHTDASNSDAIDDPSLHVNGAPDVAPPRMTWDPTDRTCDGSCHGNESW